MEQVWREFQAYDRLVRPHLLEEEAIGVPLMRAYFTEAEVAKLISNQLLRKIAKMESGSFIAGMGVERFRKEFLPQEHAPSFLVWHLLSKRHYRYYQTHFDGPLRQIQSNNQEPTEKRKKFCFF